MPAWIDRWVEQPFERWSGALFQAAPDWLGQVDVPANRLQGQPVDVWSSETERIIRPIDSRCGVLQLPGGRLAGYRHAAFPRQDVLNIASDRGIPFQFPYKRAWGLRSLAAKASLLGRRDVSHGTVAILGTSASGNYFHFLTEVVTDLWFIRQMGFAVADLDAVVVLGLAWPWQHEILSRLGIPVAKLLEPSDMRLQAERLLIPWRHKGHALAIPRWLARALHEDLGPGKRAAHGGKERLFISRRDAARRRLRNDAPLANVLERYGFRTVTLEGLGFCDQQALFRSAAVIVAEHGAGLTNLLWCSLGTRVIELHPQHPAVPCFALIAKQIGLDYRPIFFAGRTTTAEVSWEISEDSLQLVEKQLADL